MSRLKIYFYLKAIANTSRYHLKSIDFDILKIIVFIFKFRGIQIDVIVEYYL